jgi:hypothetical protein
VRRAVAAELAKKKTAKVKVLILASDLEEALKEMLGDQEPPSR